MFRLDPAQRRELRQRLESRARELRLEIAQALHGGEAAQGIAIADTRPEPGDEAVQDLEAGIEVAGVERDAAELTAVMEALARIEGEHYGSCADCGVPIAIERLRAQPQALRCVRCETERERRRARPSLNAL